MSHDNQHEHEEEFQNRYVAIVAFTIGGCVVALGTLGILLNLG